MAVRQLIALVLVLAVGGCAIGSTCVELDAGERFGVRAGICSNHQPPEEEPNGTEDALPMR